MARKLFSPATERSLRNDRVLNLAPLRFHPPSESFPLPANKDKLPRPPFLASLSTTRTRPVNFSQAFNTGNNLILERKHDPIPLYIKLSSPPLPRVHPLDLEAC